MKLQLVWLGAVAFNALGAYLGALHQYKSHELARERALLFAVVSGFIWGVALSHWGK